MAAINWRTINIDLLDPESSANFDIASLSPAVAPVSASEVQSLAGQIRQLLRGGDAEGALRGALENAPYGGDAGAKVRKGAPWSFNLAEEGGRELVEDAHTVKGNLLADDVVVGADVGSSSRDRG